MNKRIPLDRRVIQSIGYCVRRAMPNVIIVKYPANVPMSNELNKTMIVCGSHVRVQTYVRLPKFNSLILIFDFSLRLIRFYIKVFGVYCTFGNNCLMRLLCGAHICTFSLSFLLLTEANDFYEFS